MTRTTVWRVGAVSLIAVMILAGLGAGGGFGPVFAHEDDPPSTDVSCLPTPVAGTPEAEQVTAPDATPFDDAGFVPDYDLVFIDLATPHHEGAVGMAQVALLRAEHEELRELAEAIIAEQEAEIEQLNEWRDAWYADAPLLPEPRLIGELDRAMAALDFPADAGLMMHLDPAVDIAAMCDAPEPFDLAFIDAMILHHEHAITMAEVALERAVHPELRAFAEAMIETQERQIGQMLVWREVWYGGATPGAEIEDEAESND